MTDGLYPAAYDAAADTFRDLGGTFRSSTLQRVRPRSGYAVAIRGGWVSETPARDMSIATLARAILAARRRAIAAADVTVRFGGIYVGTWIDDDGRVYVDVVAIIADRNTALGFARAENQLAIYDFQQGRGISTAIYAGEDDPTVQHEGTYIE